MLTSQMPSQNESTYQIFTEMYHGKVFKSERKGYGEKKNTNVTNTIRKVFESDSGKVFKCGGKLRGEGDRILGGGLKKC